MAIKHSDLIPDYVTAESLQGLRRAMFRANAKLGSQLNFFDISQFIDNNGRKRWVAWFYKKLENVEELTADGSDEPSLP